MLFLWKKTLRQILTLTGILLGVALIARAVFEIPWNLQWHPRHSFEFSIALASVFAMDIGIHALVWRFVPNYRRSYRALVLHFDGHRIVHFAAAGGAAASEELLFRGVLLEGIRSATSTPTWLALFVSALAFGLAHTPWSRGLRIYGVFAAWEGVILGAIYIASESLMFSMLFHALHDVGGYAFFAAERRFGFWLEGGIHRARRP